MHYISKKRKEKRKSVYSMLEKKKINGGKVKVIRNFFVLYVYFLKKSLNSFLLFGLEAKLRKTPIRANMCFYYY